ncbi:MAG: MFS transporter [Gammaproteobacteria bacterium]|jgi:MFS family permease|nr:MFS transporter [Gammaproteobacteria bacterium]
MNKSHPLSEHARYRLFLGSVSLLYFLPSFDGTRLMISLPVMAEYFAVGTGMTTWVVVSYLLAATSSMLLFGRLSDVLGIRATIKTGLLIFAFFSFLCAIADHLLWLIICRFIQGLGGAMIVVAAFSAISRYLPVNQATSGYAVMNMTSAVSLTLGAPIGGLITQYLGWHWNFYLNILLVIIIYATALRNLPADERLPNFKAAIDWGGVISGFLSPFFFMLFLSFSKELGLQSILLWSMLILSICSAIFFIWWESRIVNPLVDIKLFRIEGLGLILIPVIIPIILQGGHTFLMPFYFDDIKALSITDYSMLLMIYSLIFMLAGLAGPRLMGHYQIKTIGTIAFIFMMAACALMFFGLHTEQLIVPIAYLVLMGLGFGIYNAPSTSSVMALIPKEHKGVFSGIYQIIIRSSLAMGIVFFETLYSAGTGDFSETLQDESSVGADQLQALHAAYRSAFAAGFLLIGAALIFLHGAVRRVPTSPHDRADQGTA